MVDPIEHERELYETPPELVAELLAREDFHGEIHDACAARLALVEGLARDRYYLRFCTTHV
ncbi:MAG: hypothetical protein HQ567_12580 [Candidatus Nealsonbacteria bacterium]|nr:hypothetical protein [Candidatus Nealsonbacteria bacterium]